MPSTWSQERKSQLKERLYDKALELFRERGYEATTVQRICERAGVAKGTFFNYFPSKDHVLREWYRRLTLDVLEPIEKRRFGSAKRAIAALIDGLASGAAAEPKLCGMKIRSRALSAMLAEEEQALDDQLAAYFRRHIEAGKQGGELDADLDAALFAAMIVTTLTGTSDEWGRSHQGFDLVKTMRKRLGFLFRAAAPR